ncbi:hypothetical protein ACF0H5_001346 [Mactra antiquata]
MTLKSIIDALCAEGVSTDQFFNFIRGFNLQGHPLIQDVIHELLITETTDCNAFNDWSLENMDALLNMLQDQSETADTALNEWSIEDMDDVLNILPVDQSENSVMSSSSSRQLGNTPK